CAVARIESAAARCQWAAPAARLGDFRPAAPAPAGHPRPMSPPAQPPAPSTPPAARPSAMDRFLNIIERAGNALPHPATLFAILAVLVVVLSWVASQSSLSVEHPTTGEVITPVTLLSVVGLHRIL